MGLEKKLATAGPPAMIGRMKQLNSKRFINPADVARISCAGYYWLGYYYFVNS